MANKTVKWIWSFLTHIITKILMTVGMFIFGIHNLLNWLNKTIGKGVNNMNKVKGLHDMFGNTDAAHLQADCVIVIITLLVIIAFTLIGSASVKHYKEFRKPKHVRHDELKKHIKTLNKNGIHSIKFDKNKIDEQLNKVIDTANKNNISLNEKK